MGVYVNPENSGFSEISDQDYVDKTMLIDRINQTIGKKDKPTCISRPRRFGKSCAVRMPAAYCHCSCDSYALFDDKQIPSTKDYAAHLNRYNVIYLEITSFTSQAGQDGISLREIPSMIRRAIRKDLTANGYAPEVRDTSSDFLIRCAEGPDAKRLSLSSMNGMRLYERLKRIPSLRKRTSIF